MGGFNGPGQNVVYADVDGNIGYQATGRVPLRASGDGSLPVSGADDAHEWTGYVPFEEMPSVYNPPSGIIATANGRMTPDGYKYSITKEWESPYRTERIYRVLRQNKKFNAADMLALADGRAERSGQVCGAADGVCGGPDAGSERAGQERRRRFCGTSTGRSAWIRRGRRLSSGRGSG